MRFRIHYVDSYKQAKTLIYESDTTYEAEKFAKTLNGTVECLEPKSEPRTEYGYPYMSSDDVDYD